jgi:hypothetical protein
LKMNSVRWGALTGVVLVVCSTLTVGCGSCSRASKRGIYVDPAFGPLVPPDTRLMAGVRLDKLRETPFYKKLNNNVDLQRHLDLFSQRTGLDPRKDLWQVLLVSNGRQNLVYARGRFTVGEMEPKLGALGSQRQHYKDYTLIGNPQTSVVFLNPGVAVAGSQTALKNLLDHRAEYHEIPPTFARKLASMPAEDQVWAVDEGVLRQSQTNAPDSTGMRSMLSNLAGFVKTSSVGVHITDIAVIQGEIDCVSAEGAQRVRDALKGAVGLARLNTRNDQMGILRLYDAIKINQKDTTVTIDADIASDLLEQVLKMMPELRNGSNSQLQQWIPK